MENTVIIKLSLTVEQVATVIAAMKAGASYVGDKSTHAGRINQVVTAIEAQAFPLAAADAIPDAPVVPAMRGDIEPCLRTDSERHELFPRLEALSKRLYQTQGLILSALASAGLTVVPLEPTAREVEPERLGLVTDGVDLDVRP